MYNGMWPVLSPALQPTWARLDSLPVWPSVNASALCHSQPRNFCKCKWPQCYFWLQNVFKEDTLYLINLMISHIYLNVHQLTIILMLDFFQVLLKWSFLFFWPLLSSNQTCKPCCFSVLLFFSVSIFQFFPVLFSLHIICKLHASRTAHINKVIAEN